MEKKFLGRDEILGLSDLAMEEVHIPEWNTYVRVRGMTGTERDAFEESIVERKGRDMEVNMKNMRAKLIQKCVVGEDGKPLFSPADVEALGKKNAGALQRIFNVAQRLSGISNEDVETLTKN